MRMTCAPNAASIGAIGEILGAVAVFGSLLYLAMQIKQVKSELHISSLRDTNVMGNEILASLSESPELAKVVSKANENSETLEPWELVMLDSLFMRGLNNWELTLPLKAPKDSVYNLLKQYISEPWMAEAWERTRGNYPRNFQKLIDKQFDA